MGAMELVAFVESEFGVKVEMSEVVVKNFDSISKMANFVRQKLGNQEEKPVASQFARQKPAPVVPLVPVAPAAPEESTTSNAEAA
jgi:hypothetical protein